MTEYTLTVADNGYILDYDKPQTTFVYEGGVDLPLRLMNELLVDITEAVEKGLRKIKITISVEEL